MHAVTEIRRLPKENIFISCHYTFLSRIIKLPRQVQVIYKPLVLDEKHPFSNRINQGAIKVPSSLGLLTFEHVLLLTATKEGHAHMLLITVMLVIIRIALCITTYMCVFQAFNYVT